WAVGWGSRATGPGHPLGYVGTHIEHWDGSTWSTVPSPNVGNLDNYLLGVAATGPEDVWAVGYSYDLVAQVTQTVALHWDGTAWVVVDGPEMHSGFSVLEDVTTTSDGRALAAGFGPNQSESLIEP